MGVLRDTHWIGTLHLNAVRTVSAALTLVVLYLFGKLTGFLGGVHVPIGQVVLMPAALLIVGLAVIAFFRMAASMGVPMMEGPAGLMSLMMVAFIAVGDPLIWIVRKYYPNIVPVRDFNIVNPKALILVQKDAYDYSSADVSDVQSSGKVASEGDYLEAMQLLESKDGESKRQGILKLLEITETDPSHFEAHLALAKTFSHLPKMRDQGVDFAKKALGLQPTNPAAQKALSFAHFMKGQDQYNNEDWQNAFDSYKQAIESAPATADEDTDETVLVGLLSMTATKAGRQGDFVELCTELIRRNPEKNSRRYALAMTLLDLNRSGEALSVMNEFSKSDPNSLDSHYGHARVHIAAGNVAEANKEIAAVTLLDAEKANELRNLLQGDVATGVSS